MERVATDAPARLDQRNLRLVEDKLSQTLDMLDYYGASGVIAVCLLPDGATYATAGGMCTHPDGATMGLYAGLTAIRDMAEGQGARDLVARLNEALRALAPVVVPAGARHDTH